MQSEVVCLLRAFVKICHDAMCFEVLFKMYPYASVPIRYQYR